MRVYKISKYISAALLLILFLLSACCKDIYVLDIRTKEPISEAMVLVKESNMLYPNSVSIYFTNSDGVVRTNEFGNLLVLAGKDGYWLATDYYDRKNTVYLIKQSDNPLYYEKNTPFPAIIDVEDDIQNSNIWNSYCLKQKLERKDFFIKQKKDSLDLKNEALKREIDSIKEAHFYDNWLTEEAISYIHRVTDSVLLKYINDKAIKNVELLGVFYGGLSPLNESFIITPNNVFLFTIDRLEKDAGVNPPLVFETPPGLLEKVINFKEHKFDDFKKIKVMGIADAELLMLASTNDAIEIEDKAFNIYADNPELEEIISEIHILKQKELRGKRSE